MVSDEEQNSDKSEISSGEEPYNEGSYFHQYSIDYINQEILAQEKSNDKKSMKASLNDRDDFDYDEVKANENGVEFGEQWIRKVAQGRQLKHKKGAN